MAVLKDIFARSLIVKNKEWVALLLSLLLSAAVWSIHNLSLKYSVVLAVPVLAECDGLDGFATQASEVSVVTAKCRATGFDILSDRRYDSGNPCRVRFSREHLHAYEGGAFYITGEEIANYTHAIFGESAGMENFIGDTLFFHFPRRDCKKVPVVLKANISLAPQYVISDSIELTPDSVLVYADPARLERIGAVETRMLITQTLSSEKRGILKLRVPSATRLSQQQITYRIPVHRCVEKIFYLPVRLENVPKGRNYLPSVKEVRLTANCVFPLEEGVEKELSVIVDAQQLLKEPGATAVLRLNRQPDWLLDYRITPLTVTLSE